MSRNNEEETQFGGGAWLTWSKFLQRGAIPTLPLLILLSGLIGVFGGVGASGFTILINFFSGQTVVPAYARALEDPRFFLLLSVIPSLGLIAVSWLTRTLRPKLKVMVCPK